MRVLGGTRAEGTKRGSAERGAQGTCQCPPPPFFFLLTDVARHRRGLSRTRAQVRKPRLIPRNRARPLHEIPPPKASARRPQKKF